jgi:alkyldihydroxyacetonephosphate synthase
MASSESGTGPPRRRRAGWGFEGESFPPSESLLQWLTDRLGPTIAYPSFDPSSFHFAEPHTLPHLPGQISLEPLDCLAHARGQGLPDLLRLRAGAVSALPDAVARPGSATEIEQILHQCSRSDIRVVPWGGGTSVTGAVNVLPGQNPVISLDMERLAGLEGLDLESRLATFGAGVRGPDLESQLKPHGLTLGHFPQSWELSTLGGWIATRASGQESLAHGGIDGMLAGADAVTPTGRLELAAMPSTAAGPDLRQILLGSEGRFGVLTRATVRVSQLPERMYVEALLLPSWEEGLVAVRKLTQDRLPLQLLRLSDEPETEVALRAGLADHSLVAPLLRGWIRLRGIRGSGCLLLCGAAGSTGETEACLDRAAAILRCHGAVALGRRPGRRWLEDRFRHPYLRDSLLDRGIATDTLETAAAWSSLPSLAHSVRAALESALREEQEATSVLCHLSHPYQDGASLYFTFFFRCPTGVEEALSRWARLKRRATEALLETGGTLTHHHGVGRWHAPWLEREVGSTGHRLLAAAARAVDPEGILNPQVLLDPEDRLEA